MIEIFRVMLAQHRPLSGLRNKGQGRLVPASPQEDPPIPTLEHRIFDEEQKIDLSAAVSAPSMALTGWQGKIVRKQDILVAENYHIETQHSKRREAGNDGPQRPQSSNGAV